MLATIIQWLTIYILIITIIYSVFSIKEGYTDTDTSLIDKLKKQKLHEFNGLSDALCNDISFAKNFASGCLKIRTNGNTIYNGLPDIGTYDCAPAGVVGGGTYSRMNLKQCAEKAAASPAMRGFKYNDKTKHCILVKNTNYKFKNIINRTTKTLAPKPSGMCFTTPKITGANGSQTVPTEMTLDLLAVLTKKCSEKCNRGCDSAYYGTKGTVKGSKTQKLDYIKKIHNYQCTLLKINNPEKTITDTNRCAKENKVYHDDSQWNGYIYYPKADKCFKSNIKKKPHKKLCDKPCYTLSDKEFQDCLKHNAV